MEASAGGFLPTSFSSLLLFTSTPHLLLLSLLLSQGNLLLLFLPLTFPQHSLCSLLIEYGFEFLERSEEFHLHTLFHDHAFQALFRNVCLGLERVVIAEQDQALFAFLEGFL